MVFRNTRSRLGLTPQMRKELQYIVTRWENQSNITVTPNAFEFIILTFSSIKQDPARSWIYKNDSELIDAQNLLMSRLPDALYKIANESKSSQIDTFTLLHSVTSIIDWLCPFRKPKKNEASYDER